MFILHLICIIAVILSSYRAYKLQILLLSRGITSYVLGFQGLYRFSWMFWGTERRVVIITFLYFYILIFAPMKVINGVKMLILKAHIRVNVCYMFWLWLMHSCVYYLNKIAAARHGAHLNCFIICWVAQSLITYWPRYIHCMNNLMCKWIIK